MMLVQHDTSLADEIDSLAPPRKRRANPEAGIQRAILHWCLWVGIFAHHSPNEGKRSQFTGRRLKAEGMLPGFPDLTLGARGNVLFVEVKAPEGRISRQQHECHERMRRAGLRVVVVRSLDEAQIACRDAGLLP